MILSGFSPPKFGQLPKKNEGGVEVEVGREGGDSYLFRKKCPKVAIFQGKKRVKIARLDVLRIRFSRNKFLLSSLNCIQIWISKKSSCG
jgi:hypothetical protein